MLGRMKALRTEIHQEVCQVGFNDGLNSLSSITRVSWALIRKLGAGAIRQTSFDHLDQVRRDLLALRRNWRPTARCSRRLELHGPSRNRAISIALSRPTARN